MVSMRDKLKDVELSPYMLAIYKDNEHNHLIKHALACWKHRTQNGTKTVLRPLDSNPIHYCRTPPLELIIEYNLDYKPFLSSRVLECPRVARWAFEHIINAYSNESELLKTILDGQQPYLPRVVSLIDFDEELIYKVIYAGISGYMPASFQFKLTDDQKLAATFCA